MSSAGPILPHTLLHWRCRQDSYCPTCYYTGVVGRTHTAPCTTITRASSIRPILPHTTTRASSAGPILPHIPLHWRSRQGPFCSTYDYTGVIGSTHAAPHTATPASSVRPILPHILHWRRRQDPYCPTYYYTGVVGRTHTVPHTAKKKRELAAHSTRKSKQ